ncbi:hypothetical protein BTM25_02430 [Actinomadura rubteroloni]|uniref:DUF8083 domain-containing protein n=1 Tax=Actinomadura rubteroloni TaxID=1926885 RepID=A0A2P4ULD6_9ACTN|nr:hypothetical protein [Actinomadura rubteroloni]POM25860.1 hypothetical protein BTM25_02430 [Actinomadura rubteroloni]
MRGVLPYAAYLRVYEPVTAFPEPERTVWTAYAESRRRPRRAGALEAEQREALARLVERRAAPERESRDAYVRRAGDLYYVAPWGTRLRCWLAFERFRDGATAALADAALPPVVADAAGTGLERWRRAGRSLDPHILSSTWHVPAAWLVPFRGEERCRELPPDGESAADVSTVARALLYTASLTEGRRRIAEALPVVATADEGVLPVDTAELTALDRWLTGFHPGSLVELDYGGLVHLLDEHALETDMSVVEMAVALTASRRGEHELAVAAGERLRARWRRVRALESAN